MEKPKESPDACDSASPSNVALESSPPAPAPSNPLETLSAEIHQMILFNLDSPSAVCLALTSHDQYDRVLSTFEVTRLQQLCPPDVRDRVPRRLEEHAYNLLEYFDDRTHEPPRPICYIGNFTLARKQTMARFSIEERMIRSMAYIRRVVWLFPEHYFSDHFDVRPPGIPGNGYDSTQHPLSWRIPVPRLNECKTFVSEEKFLDRYGGDLNDRQFNRMVQLRGLWRRVRITSVEYMVLHELLTPWRRNIRSGMSR